MMDLLLMTFAPEAMWAQALLLILGIVVVLKGADWLTAGAVGFAQRLGVPQIVIGLTVVAIGTSMPEFCVSMVSAIQGTSDLAVGNIVGSNVFNALLIVGCAAMVAPITILRSTVRRDIPVALFASALLLVMTLDGLISRADAAILFALFIAYMAVTIRGARGGRAASPSAGADTPSASGAGGAVAAGTAAQAKAWRAVLLIVAGLAGLIVGSNVFVDNASALARSWGVSDAVIGLTIVAGGTSLPELATSVVAARKGNSGLAIGNVLGSNVFNILLILGVTGLIAPMAIQGITIVDLAMMVLSMLLLWLFSFTKLRIERWEGCLLVAVFIGYMAYLLS